MVILYIFSYSVKSWWIRCLVSLEIGVVSSERDKGYTFDWKCHAAYRMIHDCIVINQNIPIGLKDTSFNKTRIVITLKI